MKGRKESMARVKETDSLMCLDIKDPVGMRYEDVTVVKELEPRITSDNRRCRRVLLRCKCGKEFERDLYNFVKHRVKRCRSCGTKLGIMNKIPDEDLIGMKFGRLTVKSVERKAVGNGSSICMVTCTCECGNTSITDKIKLMSGNTKSCGCYQRSVAREHVRNEEYYMARKSAAISSEEGRQRRSQNIGKKYNKLTILEVVEPEATHCIDSNEKEVTMVKVRCDCGKEFTVPYYRVTSGQAKMCRDCWIQRVKRTKDIEIQQCIGKKFNRLTILAETEPKMYKCKGQRDSRCRMVLIQCECGEMFEAIYWRVINGSTKMCKQCAYKERGRRIAKGDGIRE